jgi:hypothetical protein
VRLLLADEVESAAAEAPLSLRCERKGRKAKSKAGVYRFYAHQLVLVSRSPFFSRVVIYLF